MITIKNAEEIKKMKASADILKKTLELVSRAVRPGITTAALDKIAYEHIIASGGVPSFLNYSGYPASICASIDEVVVHGIPDKRVLEEGEIIGIDIGVFYQGFHSDAARTFAIGRINQQKQKLIKVAEQSFFTGVALIKDGVRLGDVSAAIQKVVEDNGFSVIREMVGHGIGRNLHEDPQIPNYGLASRGVKLSTGMALAIEPMISAGEWRLTLEDDGWTVKTIDRSPSAHYENTIIVTPDGAEIITLYE